MNGEPQCLLGPANFLGVQEVQGLVRTQEDALRTRNLGAAGIRTEVVDLLSEMLRSAAEHGMTKDGAGAHVRTCPTGEAWPSTERL